MRLGRLAFGSSLGLFLVLQTPLVGHAEEDADGGTQVPLGVVVEIGGKLDLAALTNAASSAGGAKWRGERLVPTVLPQEPPPAELVATLHQLYVEADFLRCLSTLQSEALETERLVASGHRTAAAQVAVLRAACAFGASDVATARAVLDRAIVQDLDLLPELSNMTPELQALSESVQSKVLEEQKVDVVLHSQPEGAAISVDGVETCARAPCPATLRPGRHVLCATLLGYLSRTSEADVTEKTELILALDPAPSDLVRAQLQSDLARGRQSDEEVFARESAKAFAARVMVLVSAKQPSGAQAAIYDRGLNRIVARANVEDPSPDAGSVAVRAVVEEWRGIVEPVGLLESPWFWAASIGVAAASAVLVYVLTLQPDKKFYAEFPSDPAQ